MEMAFSLILVITYQKRDLFVRVARRDQGGKGVMGNRGPSKMRL